MQRAGPFRYGFSNRILFETQLEMKTSIQCAGQGRSAASFSADFWATFSGSFLASFWAIFWATFLSLILGVFGSNFGHFRALCCKNVARARAAKLFGNARCNIGFCTTCNIGFSNRKWPLLANVARRGFRKLGLQRFHFLRQKRPPAADFLAPTARAPDAEPEMRPKWGVKVSPKSGAKMRAKLRPH